VGEEESDHSSGQSSSPATSVEGWEGDAEDLRGPYQKEEAEGSTGNVGIGSLPSLGSLLSVLDYFSHGAPHHYGSLFLEGRVPIKRTGSDHWRGKG